MTRADAIILVTNLILGWIAASLLAGGLALNAFALAIALAVILWILLVSNRAHVVFAIIGVIAGLAIGLLIPQLRLPGDPTLLALALLVFAYKV